MTTIEDDILYLADLLVGTDDNLSYWIAELPGNWPRRPATLLREIAGIRRCQDCGYWLKGRCTCTGGPPPPCRDSPYTPSPIRRVALGLTQFDEDGYKLYEICHCGPGSSLIGTGEYETFAGRKVQVVR